MQTSTVVKKHAVPTYVMLGVIIALIVVGCAITPLLGPGVSIHEPFVEIYPGTNISSADQKALDAVLKQFSKSLYKIRTYDRGKLVKTQGSLEDVRIPQKLVAEVTKASQEGFSDSTLVLGDPIALNWTSGTKGPTPTPSPQSTSVQIEAKRLVKAVTPIVGKYTPQ